MSKSRTSAYWKKRFEALENASNTYGQQTFRQIEPAFDKAQKQIQGQIEAWYGRYAKNNNITMQEARRQLSTTELKEFRWDVKEYIKYGRENDLNQMWMKELENASARVHVERLYALKVRTQQALEVAFGNELDCIDTMARKVFTEDYYHTIYEVQKGFRIGWEIGQIDTRKLNTLVSKPWAADGKNFSERIWQQRSQLVSELHTQLTRTCVLGKAPDDAINAITKKFKTTKNQAGRLVMTEQAYFHSVAQQEAFKDLDVEEFEVVATLDSHTSDICQEMDGKHFPMKDYQPGVTAPPFHVWCRSVTVPYFEDNYTGERAARDEDGNTYYVPDSMTYPEWKKSMVDGNTDGLEVADKTKLKIESVADIQTFDEMQSYMKKNYDITIDNSVGLLDFESVREGVQGIEYIIKEFPQARESFKTIGTKKSGLMCASYDGDINFNPGYYQTRKSALWNHGIGEGTSPSGLHPKGNNCFGSGTHEAGHILEKALVDKINGETIFNRFSWIDGTYAKALVSDACKAVKKLPECKGMGNSQLKGAISGYAKSNDSECLAEAVCDVSLNGENASPLSKMIWEMLKKELG